MADRPKPSYACLALGVACACLALGRPASAKNTPKRIVFFISEGFYATEYYEPRAIFDKEGFKVQVAAKLPHPVRPDPRQWETYPPVKPDLTFDQVEVSSFDAIVFAGGNGAWEDFFPNDAVHKLLSRSLESGKLTALLCSSTGLLGVANNLNGQSKPIAEGRHVTGYYRVEGLLRNLGRVNYDPGEAGKPHVVTDGNLITGRDPSSAKLFGETVARALKKR